MTPNPPHKNNTAENDSTRHLPFYDLLNQDLLIAAFNRLIKYGEKKMLWELTDRLKQMRQNYLYMIEYALSGAPDAQRSRIKGDLKADLCRIYEQMRRESELQRSTTIYATTAKSMAQADLGALVTNYVEKENGSEAAEEAAGMSKRIELEGLQRDIFNYLWTRGHLTEEEFRMIKDIPEKISNKEMISLIIAALLLGTLAYNDERRVWLLVDFATDEKISVDIRTRAFVALTLGVYANRQSYYSNSFKAFLEERAEHKDWATMLKSATMEFARTLDTKRVSDDMQAYFRESFSKIGDEVRKSMKDLEKIDVTELEENPEWMEMLDRTGLSEKMRQLSDIQEEGGDVFLQPFKQLKGDAFFYEAANWFLPFTPARTEVKKIDPEGLLAEMVAETPFLCDNDKYSFIFAMRGIPEEQRKLMLSQLEAGNIGASQEVAASMNLWPEQINRQIRKHIQNLYRFFNLFRRASDFKNPFASEINLINSWLLRQTVAGNEETIETAELLAEFYFKHKYYSQALDSFLGLEGQIIPTPDNRQKMGYCLERLGRLDEALNYYEQAELLDSRSEWTIKRIARLKQALGAEGEALKYYSRLLQDKPDDIGLLNSAARCNLAVGNYDEAIKQWYKVDYLSPDNISAIRGLSLAYLAKGDLTKSRPLLEKISRLTVLNDADHINTGHLALIEGKGREAIEHYMAPISDEESFARVMGIITSDAELLLLNGVDKERQQLLIEALTWRFQQQTNDK